ncbi:MAG TPA: hypothetical protein VIK60_01960 [Vicinamibacterales bacterium]
MTSSSIPRWISAVWILLTLLIVLAVDASSVYSWALMTTIGIVPTVILHKLWSDGPPPTIAEVLYATEIRR